MNCTYCQQELNYYKKSAEIPSEKNWHYIAHSCGNVMKAEMQNGTINVLQNTSTTDSPETFEEMMLAKSLFEKAGNRISGYSVDNPNGPDYAHKREVVEEVAATTEEVASPLENTIKEKKSFMAKIRDFCKKFF
jgi:hypothetical protein